MFRFLALLALAAVAYGEADVFELDDPTRIVGGTNANINNVPWQVSVRWNNNHFCGATLISNTWAVCAAHCTINRPAGNSLTLLVGTANRLSGGQVRAVSQVINHPNYNARNADNDISLVRAASAFTLGTAVRAATLPAQGAAVPAVGTYALVSGWGHTREGGTSPVALQQLWVPIVDHARCNTALRNWGGITGNMFCAGYWNGGRDSCQGDSGGPLVRNNQLIGVVSWGIGCARANLPGVYVRASNYRTWIRGHTGI